MAGTPSPSNKSRPGRLQKNCKMETPKGFSLLRGKLGVILCLASGRTGLQRPFLFGAAPPLLSTVLNNFLSIYV